MWASTKVFSFIFIFMLSFHSIFDTVALAEQSPENRTVEQQLKEAEEQNRSNIENSDLEDDESNINVDETPLDLQEEPSLIWSFIKLIGALTFVIFLMFWLLKLFTNRSKAFRTNRTIENIGGVPLGANRSVQIVRIGDRLLVVGVGENVQLLKELDTTEEVEQLIGKHEQELERLDVPITKFFIRKKSREQKNQGGKREVEFSSMLKRQLEDVSESQKKVHEAMREQRR